MGKYDNCLLFGFSNVRERKVTKKLICSFQIVKSLIKYSVSICDIEAYIRGEVIWVKL